MKTYTNIWHTLVSPETLFFAWEEFKKDKGTKSDVLVFEQNLEQHILQLYRDLKNKKYRHGPYEGFWICDPKRRHIHKATVRDRVVHHAIFTLLNPIFEPTFISGSFSCRVGKGTHRGVLYLRNAIRAVSKNYTKSCYVLKCDIKKFFDSIDHQILIEILEQKVKDTDMQWLLCEVIGSYSAEYCSRERERESKSASRQGIPIGNLVSQLFANVYMNEFDQFVKHGLQVKYYARYTDDFVMVAETSEKLKKLLPKIEQFLKERLKILLHPDKIQITPHHRGVDFLGYVIFPHHILLRKKTEKRITRRIREKIVLYQKGKIEKEELEATLQSYLGILSHANAHRFSEELKNEFWLQQCF